MEEKAAHTRRLNQTPGPHDLSLSLQRPKKKTTIPKRRLHLIHLIIRASMTCLNYIDPANLIKGTPIIVLLNSPASFSTVFLLILI